jgi:hypothetical protein
MGRLVPRAERSLNRDSAVERQQAAVTAPVHRVQPNAATTNEWLRLRLCGRASLRLARGRPREAGVALRTGAASSSRDSQEQPLAQSREGRVPPRPAYSLGMMGLRWNAALPAGFGSLMQPCPHREGRGGLDKAEQWCFLATGYSQCSQAQLGEMLFEATQNFGSGVIQARAGFPRNPTSV